MVQHCVFVVQYASVNPASQCAYSCQMFSQLQLNKTTIDVSSSAVAVMMSLFTSRWRIVGVEVALQSLMSSAIDGSE